MVYSVANGATTILMQPVAQTDVVIYVESSTYFPQNSQFDIRIDSELMLVTSMDSVNPLKWNVNRGQQNTVAIPHQNGALITNPITASFLNSFVSTALPLSLTQPSTGTPNFLEWHSNTSTLLGFISNTGNFFLENAPVATANYGLLNIGSGPWDGISTGYFKGATTGTGIAANFPTTFGGNLVDIQSGGVSQFSVSNQGVVLARSTFSSAYIIAQHLGDATETGALLQTSSLGLSVVGQKASAVQLAVKGAASQTADLQQWQNNTGGVAANVTAQGIGIFQGGSYGAQFSVGDSYNLISGPLTQSATQGLLNIGNGGFNSTSAGSFSGNTLGTAIAINLASATNYGDIINAQTNGTSVFSFNPTSFNGSWELTLGGSDILKFQGNAGGGAPGISGIVDFTSTEMRQIVAQTQGAQPTSIPLISKGRPSQSADLQQWVNWNSTILNSVNATGVTNVFGNLNAVAAPPVPTLTTNAGTGGSLAAGTFIYAYSYIDGSGRESYKSPTLSVTTTGTTSAITIGITATTAGSINIYRSYPTGQTLYYLTNIAYNSTSFQDTGVISLSALRHNIDSTQGLVNIGSGGFGGGTGSFSGNANGTGLAINTPSNFTGHLMDLQQGGTSYLSAYVSNNEIFLYAPPAIQSSLYGPWNLQAASLSSWVSYFNMPMANSLNINFSTAQASGHFIIKAAPSQTGDIQQWQNNAGTVQANITSGGRLVAQGGYDGRGNTDFITTIQSYHETLDIQNSGLSVGVYGYPFAYGASLPLIQFRAAGNQSSDIQQWQNTHGTILDSINATGVTNVFGNFNAVGAPAPPTLTTNATTGGTLPAGAFKYEYSYVDVNGLESYLSSPLTVTTTGTTSAVTIGLTATTTGSINIYRTNAGGSILYYLTNIADTSTSFKDDGTITLSTLRHNSDSTQGLMNIGSGGFAGGAGSFNGDPYGTGLAVNIPSGFFGKLVDIQINGTSNFYIWPYQDVVNTNLYLQSEAGLQAPSITGLSQAGGTALNIPNGTPGSFSIAAAPSQGTTDLFQWNTNAGTVLSRITSSGAFTSTATVTLPDVSTPATAPTATVDVAAGNLGIGTYTYAVGFITPQGTTLAGPTVTSAATVAGSQQITVGSIPIGGSGVTERQLYRSKVGTTNPLYQLAVLSDNSTTSYTDNIADTSLTVAAPTVSTAVPLAYIEGTPPTTANYGLLNVGPGPWDGTSAGHFAGNVNGTALAIDMKSGYTGDYINISYNGSTGLKYDGSYLSLLQVPGLGQPHVVVQFLEIPSGGAVVGDYGLVLRNSGQPGSPAVTIQGTVGQTADIQQWQNSAGTVLAKVDASGNFTAASLTGTLNPSNLSASSNLPTGVFLAATAPVSGNVPQWSGTAWQWASITASGMANPMTTLGDIIYGSATGTPATASRLGIGATGQVLTVVAGIPGWATPSSGFSDPETTAGDMIFRNATNATARLPVGTVNQVLTSVGATLIPTWGLLTTSNLSATAGIVAGQIASVNPSVLTGTGTIPLAAITGLTNTQLSGTAGITSGNLSAVGTAGTYAYPASIVTDAAGRVTGVTAGSAGVSLSAANTWTGTQSFSSGTLALTNATSNLITFPQVGVSPPSSVSGHKIDLYGSGSTAYSIGIDNNTLWFNTANQFVWYVNSTQIAKFDSGGNITATSFSGTINPSNLTGAGTVPLAAIAGLTNTQLSGTAGITAANITSINLSAIPQAATLNYVLTTTSTTAAPAWAALPAGNAGTVTSVAAALPLTITGTATTTPTVNLVGSTTLNQVLLTSTVSAAATWGLLTNANLSGTAGITAANLMGGGTAGQYLRTTTINAAPVWTAIAASDITGGGNLGLGTGTITSGAITSGAITSSGVVQGTTLTSTIATGTAPFTVTSTTTVPNLSAASVGTIPASNVALLLENLIAVSPGTPYAIPDVTSETITHITLTIATTLTFPAAVAGKSFLLAVSNGATAYAITWPTNIQWSGGGTAPALSGVNLTDTFSFICIDGTNWLGYQTGTKF